MEVDSKTKTTSKLNKIDKYKAQMEEIGFMAEHLENIPEIFDVHSEKCKHFLVKTFSVLNANFHYLSFLGDESIGQELAKVASILRIYPYNINQKSSEIFDSMNEKEIHKFWMRLFKLCKINSQYIDSNSINKITCSNGEIHSIFSDVNKAMQYFNYDIPLINPNKLKEIDVNKEVESWIHSSFLTSMNESNSGNANQELTFEEEHEVNVDIDKLILDIDYIKKKADFESLDISEVQHPYEDFFISFNNAVNTVKNFRENVNFVSSFNMQDLLKNTKLHKECYWLSNNCQIKRCNNIIQNIMLLK